MTKEQIKQYMDDDIAYQCEESGLDKEDIMFDIIHNLIYRYEKNELSKEDFLQCMEYIEVKVDIDEIDKDIAKRKELKAKRKMWRQKRRERLLQERRKQNDKQN